MFEYDPDDVTWPDSDYTAEITVAEDAIRKKNGEAMLKFTWQVFWGNKTQFIFDYIGSWNLNRLKRLCAASGVDFKGGKVDPAQFAGKQYKVKLKTHNDDNVISGFESFDGTTPAAGDAPPDDADIPF